MTTDKRLGRLEAVYRRREAARPEPATGFDATRLDPCEQAELALLLERAEHGPRPAGVRTWAFAGLCDCLLDRASELTRKAHGLAPAPSAPDGPCRGCVAAELADAVAPYRRAHDEHVRMMEARRR